MEAKDIVVIVAATVSALVTIGVPVVNHFLSRQRYAQEKLWDIRREAYSKVLSSLSQASEHYFVSDILWDDEKKKKSRDAGWSAFRRAQAAYHDIYVVCSDEFSAAMDKADSEIVGVSARIEGYSGSDIGNEITKYHDILLAQARRELRL